MIDRVAGRLFLSYLAVVAVSLLVASVGIGSLLVRFENEATRQRLLGIEQPILTAVTNGLRQGRSTQDVVQGLTDEARAVEARILVVATGGRRVQVDSEGRLDGQVLLPVPSGIAEVFTFHDGDEEWLFVQRAVNPAATLVVARPRAAFGQTVRQLLPSIGVSAAAAAALTGSASPAHALGTTTTLSNDVVHYLSAAPGPLLRAKRSARGPRLGVRFPGRAPLERSPGVASGSCCARDHPGDRPRSGPLVARPQCCDSGWYLSSCRQRRRSHPRRQA